MTQLEVRDDAMWQFAGVVVSGLSGMPAVDVECEVVASCAIEPDPIIAHDFPRLNPSDPGGGQCRRCGIDFKQYKALWPQRVRCMAGSNPAT